MSNKTSKGRSPEPTQGRTRYRHWYCVKNTSLKKYADEVNDLNEMAKHRPHAALVAGIQQENRHLRDLQQENRELRAALEEQQNALELIMSKYRQQITKLAHSSQIDLTKLYNKKYTEIIIDQAIKISEMTHIMGKAVQADEDSILKTEEEIHQLATENKGLRELLAISSKHNPISLINEPYT
ncbi:unnamed protein product [Nezara viridula]|uniref:Uncharacterized protein n=1 Tax=Nezara viridula TaxID=85310 RepID=A0A9P0EBL1_NEZVI|nr:unnamed protein product [Nezara viridula]